MNEDTPRTLTVLPAFLVLVLIAAAIGIRSPLLQLVVQLPLALLYPFKLRSDAKHIHEEGNGWRPNITLYTIYGVLVAVTLGVASLVVSPYYIYRRKSVS